MRWNIHGRIYDDYERVIYLTSSHKIGQREASVLDVLIKHYGIKRANELIRTEAWGEDNVSGYSLSKAIQKLRNALECDDTDLHSIIDSGPYRLIKKPVQLPDEGVAHQGDLNSISPQSGTLPLVQTNDGLSSSERRIAQETIQSIPRPVVPLVDGDYDWPEFLLEISRPEERVIRFAERFNATDRWIIGPVIEVFSHPFLDSAPPLTEAGWAPDQVRLVDGGSLDTSAILSDVRVAQSFERAEALRRAQNKGTALEEPNNDKYALADASTPFHDTTDLTLTFKSTKYFSILRTRPAVESIPEVWMDYGDIHPRGNRIPQALGMQFSAIFGGQEILAIYRDVNTFPFPNTWSFSGEEQLDKSDLRWDEPARMKRALLRTAQEEIFPLARIYDRNKLLSAMNIVEPHISSMRVWSVFLEGPTATFQMFCVYAFDFSIANYADLIKEMIRRGLGQMSREGGYFSINLSDVPKFLKGQKIEAKPIFGEKPVLITSDNLHPTSRYRLVRVLNLLHGEAKSDQNQQI